MLREEGTYYTRGTEITLYKYLVEKLEGKVHKCSRKDNFKMDP